MWTRWSRGLAEVWRDVTLVAVVVEDEGISGCCARVLDKAGGETDG